MLEGQPGAVKRCRVIGCLDQDKAPEDKQKEEDLLQQIHKLVEMRDFLVDDVEFERLRWDHVVMELD